MTYVPLGYRPTTAVKDTTGHNPGNWTATLDSALLGITVPVFEMYHLYFVSPQLAGAPTTCTVMINQGFWDITLIGQANSWDPSQPPLLQPGDYISLLFNVPVSSTPAPVVTAWFRYER